MDQNQNRKIVIACIFGMLLIAALVVGGILYTTLSKDTKGAAEDLTVLFSKRYVEGYDITDNTIYKIHINSEYWDYLNVEQRAEYCANVSEGITNILWNHKVLPVGTYPIVRYYVNGIRVSE